MLIFFFNKMLLNGLIKATHQKPQISESSSDGENGQNNKSNFDNSYSFLHNTSGVPILKKDTGSILNPESIQLLPKFKTKTNNKKKTIKKGKGKDKKIFQTLDPFSRFTIVHNDSPEKKHLDNSYEDYFFYEIVDDDSFNHFFSMTEIYISKRLNDKILRLYNSLKRQISDTIEHGLKELHLYPELIPKVINKTFNKKTKKKSLCQRLCSCCCCFKPKEKIDLENDHNMRQRSETINNELSNFANDIEDKFSDKNIEQFCIINQEETEQFAKQKSKVFFNKKGMKERLRLEVESYSKYFNIERIIEKQENTLETQKKKINKLDDIKELNECIICMEKQRNMIFFPCHHLICCDGCGYNKVKYECPECKKKIERKTITN